MDSDKIKEYIGELSSDGDKKAIYRNLIKIRADVVKTREGIEIFHEHGGLKPLVELIKKPNEKIIDVSLSILGNCCTVEKCAKKAGELGVVAPLILLLRTITNDSIQCRTCRILGNIAADDDIAKQIYDRGVSSILMTIIDETKPIPTLVMAVRLVTKMWKIISFQIEARRNGIIRRMMMIVIKYSRNETNVGASTSAEATEEDMLTKMHPNREFRESTRKSFKSMIKRMENARSDIFDYAMLGKEQPESAPKDDFVAPMEADKCDLISGILRCLQIVVKNNGSLISDYIHADGSGYKCLVALGRSGGQFRGPVLSILSSLVFTYSTREDIGCANAVSMASELLQRNNPNDAENCLSALEIRCCVNLICLLAEDSCNRAKIRHGGALKQLLQRFRETECRQERDMIMYGFTFFCYDQMSICLLVREGLIGALIKRLTEELADAVVDHVPIEKGPEIKVTKRKKFAESDIAHLMKRLRSKSPKPSHFSEPGSPGSSSGFGSLYANHGSPSSFCSISPKSNSPRSTDLDSDDESVNYSPVCSDNEEEIKQPVVRTEERRDVEHEGLSHLCDDDSQNSFQAGTLTNILDENSQEAALLDAVVTKELQSEGTEKSTIKRILLLLRDMPLRLPHAPELAKLESLSVLLKTCRFISNPHAYCNKILYFIVQDTKNFVPLLQHDFIIDIYRLRHTGYDHVDCQSCAEMKTISTSILGGLSAIAESGYGRGELAHYLLTGEREMRKHVAILTIFIIRDRKFLYTFLVDHSALYTVMEIILTDDKALGEKACLGITALAENLNICDGQVDDKTENRSYDEDNYATGDDGVISFVVKDNERVDFSENILKECSDVFKSMLTSQFKESINKEIHIADVSVAGIKYFLNLLVLSRSDSLECVPLAFEMAPALEAYELSMRYMLSEIEAALLGVIRKVISEKSVLNVFEWAMNNNNRQLLEISVYYYLSSDICGKKKLSMFREADLSEYGNQWNQLMLDTIVDKCVASMEVA
uniref:BTB domain-containing protein n=1 Tax=Phlebotomus kandelakii TaxID=1109342 RepID=A0A6B2E838_9DIPT